MYAPWSMPYNGQRVVKKIFDKQCAKNHTTRPTPMEIITAYANDSEQLGI